MSFQPLEADREASLEELAPGLSRVILVEAPRGERVAGAAARKPKTVARLQDWQYVERSIHRMIAGWGAHFCEWNDITTCHRHVWEQAECVRRLRERLEQFPGSSSNLDAPVSHKLEALVNTVLLAPSFHDAVDGIYGILMRALTRSYQLYGATAHAVHDAPTLATLHEIVGIKEGMRLWRQEFRRRFPHTTDPEYRAAIEAQLRECGDLLEAVPLERDADGEALAAGPVGLATDFPLAAEPGRPRDSWQDIGIGPFLARDFSTSIEARRLFWCYAYMLEMNLAIGQLRWVYNAHYMPWEFLQDLSRHLWDESRHGDSGYARLLDFGLGLADTGFMPYGMDSEREESRAARRELAADPPTGASGQLPPMTPRELYDAVFVIGMVAETGHFVVKREGYDDFVEGGDLESAEMMLFDIIDETTHVGYAHRWLPLLAQHAGVDNTDYKERGAQMRREAAQNHDLRVAELAAMPVDPTDPDYLTYQKLLARMRAVAPLSNAETCPPRSPLPM